MRIFLAGASGVIGRRLVPLLVDAGHVVIGATRSPEKTELLTSLGAEPVACDVFDGDALREIFSESQPDAVMHQLTDLPDDPGQIGEFALRQSRIRRVGTRNLIAACEVAPVRQFVAQSVAWEMSGEGAAAKQDLEDQVLGVSGVVLRYGQFYGPGTYYEEIVPDQPRIQIDEAARRTLFSLDASSGIYEIVDEV